MKNKKLSFLIYLPILIIIFFLIFFNKNNEKEVDKHSIDINFITSVHSSLPWEFRPSKPDMKIVAGEVTTVDYFVTNLSNKKSSGVASFAYYPKELENYFTKINCFCYDPQTLEPGETKKYSLTLLFDPQVTKDSKTKQMKKVIMQFTFFSKEEFEKQNK